ncbi:hypothetical protein ACTOB_001118 [Actinoplanes oblitus]|uniref:Aminoglycoside phosphotransferase n=1 Tax=Actinoplanes oblitus TaxID=3040509 RepID=A0ABY8WIE2_9ACTN|nr:hypothetical protein [Actinoplanes oblitus]WIM97585.1 hypothetical protein ACTOB_001118 [Actinoplanes oblitus]
MPTSRIPYAELPGAVRHAVEDITGSPESLEPASDGLNSAIAVKLNSPKGAYFVKALPADHRWVRTQQREAAMAPYLDLVAPKLHARLTEGGWDVLVFEALEGHRADYAPNSPDLPIVVDLLRRIAGIQCPPVTLRCAEQRLQAYAGADELRYFAGDALLHTDLNNANVIVTGDRARVVDWGWATQGAPWLDAGYWVIWLIAAGHTPDSAEAWASLLPSWQAAHPRAVNAFAGANARMWADIGGAEPDAWTRRLIDASAAWRDYRGRNTEAELTEFS